MTNDRMDHDKPRTNGRIDLLDALKASLIFVGVSAAACLLWVVRDGLLVIFAAAIAAILLKVLANAISRWTRLPGILSLLVATLLIVIVVIVAGWLFGTHVAAEFSDVFKRATTAWNKISQQLQNSRFASVGQKIERNTAPEISSSVREGFSMLTEAIEALVVLVVSALYLAAEPRLYRTGVIKLFKPELQVWAGERIDTLGQTMKLWLYGQLLTMLLVGVLSGLATWIIGVPGPLALGLISFITEAIPYLGPFLGGIPAVLVATTKGFDASLYTAIAFLLVHVIEGYLFAPLIQRSFVSIPPAVMLLGITSPPISPNRMVSEARQAALRLQRLTAEILPGPLPGDRSFTSAHGLAFATTVETLGRDAARQPSRRGRELRRDPSLEIGHPRLPAGNVAIYRVAYAVRPGNRGNGSPVRTVRSGATTAST